MKFDIKKLKPETRKWVVWAGGAIILIILGIPVYNARNKGPDARFVDGEYKILGAEGKTTDYEQALVTRTQAEIDNLRNEIKNLQKEMKRQQSNKEKEGRGFNEKEVTSTGNRQGDTNGNTSSGPTKDDMDRIRKSVEEQLKKRNNQKTDIAAQKIFPESTGVNNPVVNKVSEAKPSLGIETVKGYEPKTGSNNDTIYLPPSFMDASSLTGVVAPTTKVGEDHPIPILIRIKDMAVLPNEVKEDLKGCFLIASGVGDLSQERVKAHLLNLSCITKKGASIIDQEVKGWVVDADGRAGLSGHVVAKYGSHIARVAIAGFLEGFGEAMQLSVTDTTTNVFGTQSSNLENTDTDTLLKAGTGQAIVGVANDLQQFYLDIAKQTMPTIEVGPKKDITVVISEGTELIIKERKKYAQND